MGALWQFARQALGFAPWSEPTEATLELNTPEAAPAWIQTWSGARVDVFNPDPATLRIVDIAHGLANKCRFNGHTCSWYSVAQHSVLVSQLVPEDLALAALLHDAAEAYLPDMPSPIKARLPGFDQVEAGLMQAIAEQFRLPWPMPEAVAIADRRIVADEAFHFMGDPGDWPSLPTPVGVSIRGESPEVAKQSFLARYLTLCRRRDGNPMMLGGAA